MLLATRSARAFVLPLPARAAAPSRVSRNVRTFSLAEPPSRAGGAAASPGPPPRGGGGAAEQAPFKSNVLALSEDELKELVVSWGFPKFRATQIFNWVYKQVIPISSPPAAPRRSSRH